MIHDCVHPIKYSEQCAQGLGAESIIGIMRSKRKAISQWKLRCESPATVFLCAAVFL